MKKALLAVAFIVALGLGWWLGSPLFIDETVSEEAPVVTAEATRFDGRFRDGDSAHRGSGMATVLEVDGELVLRFEDFEVTNGPDLYVLVTPAGEVPDHDALDETGWVELGALKGNIGSQNYVLPADLSPEDLGSVVIWCRAFRVIFSVAELSPAMS